MYIGIQIYNINGKKSVLSKVKFAAPAVAVAVAGGVVIGVFMVDTYYVI